MTTRSIPPSAAFWLVGFVALLLPSAAAAQLPDCHYCDYYTHGCAWCIFHAGETNATYDDCTQPECWACALGDPCGEEVAWSGDEEEEASVLLARWVDSWGESDETLAEDAPRAALSMARVRSALAELKLAVVGNRVVSCSGRVLAVLDWETLRFSPLEPVSG